MRVRKKYLIISMAVAALWVPVGQAVAKPVVLASANSTQRFLPIERGSVSSPTSVKRVRSGLHSDVKSVKNGFMRLDRTMLVVRRGKRIQPAAVSAEAQETAGLLTPEPNTASNDPILDLFGTDGASGAQFGITKRGGDSRTSNARYTWPVAANVKQRISSGYGNRKDPFTGKKAFHAGIDIAAVKGTPVLAAASGTVHDVGVSKRYGKYVSIQHPDGNVSWYGHLSTQNVKKGSRVRKGQGIGRVGSTGRSTGPHLDFRIKHGEKFLNPETLIGSGPRSLQVAQNTRTR